MVFGITNVTMQHVQYFRVLYGEAELVCNFTKRVSGGVTSVLNGLSEMYVQGEQTWSCMCFNST